MPGGHRGDVEMVSSPASHGASHERIRIENQNGRSSESVEMLAVVFTARITFRFTFTLPMAMHFDGWAEMLNDCRV